MQCYNRNSIKEIEKERGALQQGITIPPDAAFFCFRGYLPAARFYRAHGNFIKDVSRLIRADIPVRFLRQYVRN